MSERKQQVKDLLKSIETGDPKPAAVITKRGPPSRRRDLGASSAGRYGPGPQQMHSGFDKCLR
jgi:hypothetical protein